VNMSTAWWGAYSRSLLQQGGGKGIRGACVPCGGAALPALSHIPSCKLSACANAGAAVLCAAPYHAVLCYVVCVVCCPAGTSVRVSCCLMPGSSCLTAPACKLVRQQHWHLWEQWRAETWTQVAVVVGGGGGRGYERAAAAAAGRLQAAADKDRGHGRQQSGAGAGQGIAELGEKGEGEVVSLGGVGVACGLWW